MAVAARSGGAMASSRRREHFAPAVMVPASCAPASSCADPRACLHCSVEARIQFTTTISLPMSFPRGAARTAPGNGSNRAWLRLGMHGDGVRCPAWDIHLHVTTADDDAAADFSTVFRPSEFGEFRAGGCASTTQNCSETGPRTPNDGFQTSFAELQLQGFTVPNVACRVKIVLRGCAMNKGLTRTRSPTTYVSSLSLVLEK
jgi:hypothetical protein